MYILNISDLENLFKENFPSPRRKTLMKKLLPLVCLVSRGVLPYKSLMGMCRWMGSHFHNWSDNYGVAFLIELLEWGRRFSNFGDN